MAWYVWLFLILLFAAFWFWMGMLYKGRKFRPIVAVIKDKNVKPDEKVKTLINLVT